MGRQPNLEARKQILCSAYALFFEKGYRGVSMDDVATAAKIRKANLFHYFPTKEDLGLAVFDYATSCFREKLLRDYSGDNARDPVRLVDSIFQNSVANMKKSNCCRGCFAGNLAQEMSDHSEKIRARLEGYFSLWVEKLAGVFESARENGTFRKDFKPKPAAEAIISLLEGALMFSKASKSTLSLQNARKMAVEYLGIYVKGGVHE